MKQLINNRKIKTSAAVETDWRIVAIVIVCSIGLAAGFFFAARQHFLSMDIGFKNSKLRKQLEDLESEKRRLLLAREVSLSPVELKKASKGLVAGSRQMMKAETAMQKSVQSAAAATGASLTIKPASALLAKPKPAMPQRGEATARLEAGAFSKRNIELAAAINLR